MSLTARGRSLYSGTRALHVPVANLCLRMASLVGKFGLSLIIARFVSLAELGIYGIVFSLSMFMVVLLGGRIDHELARQIVLDSSEGAGGLLRDQTVFFLLNFIVALPCFVAVGFFGLEGFGMPIAICTWAICCLESYANLLFVNTNALGRPLLANTMFFLRSGLWAFIVIALMFLFPGLRSLWTVFGLWIAGSALSIWINLAVLRARRWPTFGETPIDWGRLRSALRISSLIWVGSIGLAGGTYLDRMVLTGWLNLEAVGVATFYASFSNAVVTLVASSTLAVALPRLVRVAQASDTAAFRAEMRAAGRALVLMGLPLCVAIAVIVPYSGGLLHKPQFFDERYTLWALMIGAMLRLLAEGLYVGLYARRQDKAIWIGNLLFLAVSLAANIVLVASLGLIGLGLANVAAALFLFFVRFRGLTAGSNLRGGNNDVIR